MAKGSGNTRTIGPNRSAEVAGTGSEFDGTFYSGSDELKFRAYDGDTPTGQKEDKELWERIKIEMAELGIPMSIVGDVLVQISHGAIGDAGGNYRDRDHMIQVGIPRRDTSGAASIIGKGYAKEEQMKGAMRTWWHELGHAIHYAYYPEFSRNAVSGPIGSSAYEKAPNEEFARRFQKGIYDWKKNYSSFTNYVKSIKRSVDADVSSGKLTPYNPNGYKDKVSRVNGTKALRKVELWDGRSPKKEPSWKQQKLRAIKGGKYVILAENYIPQ